MFDHKKFLLCLLSWLPLFLAGQTLALQRQYPFSLPESEALVILNNDWQYEQHQYFDVPFELYGVESGEFTCTFDLPQEIVTDSVYICLEGVAWEAELEFNGRFLGIQPKPLSQWVVGIHKNWLQKQGNELKLRLYVDRVLPLYSRSFLGIVRPVCLLSPTQWRKRQQLAIPTIPVADTVGLVAPYFRTTGYSFDLFEALRNLYPLSKRGIRYVFFPFPASETYRALCDQLGFVIVDSLSEDTYVCPVNAYDYEPVGFPFTPRFWIDSHGYSTSYYGDIYPWKKIWVRPVPISDHLLLACLILFPLLVAFLIKLLNPGFFAAQPSLLFTPQRFVDTPNETLHTNTGLLWGLVWIRTFLLAIFLSLLMYYIQLENQWSLLNLFREWSLSATLFYQDKNLLEIFIISISIMTSWLILKYFLLELIGRIFRIKALVPRIASIDVIGTYPLILFLPIPMSLILFMDQLWGGITVIFLVFLLIGYVVRQIYVLYIGLDRFFGFSSAMKFLYICTFIIVPYMVWF